MKILSKRHPDKHTVFITGASLMADQLSKRIEEAVRKAMLAGTFPTATRTHIDKPAPKLPTKEQLEELYNVGGTQNVHRAGANDDGEVVIGTNHHVDFTAYAVGTGLEFLPGTVNFRLPNVKFHMPALTQEQKDEFTNGVFTYEFPFEGYYKK